MTTGRGGWPRQGVATVLVDGARRTIAWSVEGSTGEPWTLELRHPDGTVERFEAGDAFDALRAARAVWEPRGIRLLVQGARVDAWPSGMAREYGALRVYLLDEARVLAKEPLAMVDTFAPCDERDVATTAQQQAHHDRVMELTSR